MTTQAYEIILSALAVVSIAWGAWLHWAPRGRQRRLAWLGVATGLVLLGGAGLTHQAGRAASREQRETLEAHAHRSAAAIDLDALGRLTATESDLDSPAYVQLKQQLARMRLAERGARFFYVMVARGEDVVFVADSEPQDSDDCSLPGEAYADASEALRRVLAEGGTAVEGPLPDEWGVWVSGLASIHAHEGGPVVGLLGIDVDARRYLAAVQAARGRTAATTLAVALLVLLGGMTWHQMRRADLALRQSQLRLALHAEQTLLGLIEMDPDLRVTGWNRAAEHIFGWSASEAMGRHAVDLIVPAEARAQVDGVMRELFDSRRPVRSVNANVTKDGRTVTCEWTNTPLVDARGQVIAFASMVQDVSNRQLMEDALRQAATIDRLTGLPNRALFMDRLTQSIKRSRRDPNYHFAVLFLDFDRFKIINDSLGHKVGDLLLTEIAGRLSSELRDVDSISQTSATIDQELQRGHTAGRLGGDEFVVLLDSIRHVDHAAIVADRLLAAIARPFHCGGHELFCTASIGIVTSEICPDKADDLLRDADTAMYEAKLAGKGRYAIFDVSMRQRVQDRHGLENDLRKALASCGSGAESPFLLMYQPIVRLDDGGVESFEVLVRWRHPTRGMVSPAEFIPIAEETGMIVPLGDWIMQEACGQLSRWRRERPDTAPSSLSINLSRRQLLQPDLADRLEQVATDAGLMPSCIHLEITESAVMEDADHAGRVLGDLKQAGFKLAMDDFGTGYSSLACLHQFPLDVLKIDRSFVANLGRGRDFGALVNAIVMLARSLNIAVVAEGVEEGDQAAALHAMRCELAQGYHFGRPTPIGEAMTFLPQAREAA